MKSLRSLLTVSLVGAVFLSSRARGETASSLPSLQTLIQRVMQTSAEETTDYHKFNHHYYYTREKLTEFFDTSGKLKEREAKESTNNPVPLVSISKPAPLPEPIVSPKMASADPGPTGPSVHGVNLGKKEDLLNPDLIKRYKLTLVGQEMLNGRPALIVDFKPASNNLPIFNIKDRFLNCIAGRAWVDKNDFTLEKVDMHLTQKVSVLGGLVGTVSKFTFTFDRQRTADGFWFTRDLDWHLEAREATYQRVVDHHEEINGLQKMM